MLFFIVRTRREGKRQAAGRRTAVHIEGRLYEADRKAGLLDNGCSA
ncbi:hypothetical protein HMPREF9413_0268 [Paenibacillus sp. HGF7]|nr:hypothetical protein HMPREF9413_0268 [Paenibacillus sp. HGF7]